MHMQVCINTNSYILLHAYFVLAFYINAVIYFMRISIYKDTHTRMSVLEHWHVFLCGANMLQRSMLHGYLGESPSLLYVCMYVCICMYLYIYIAHLANCTPSKHYIARLPKCLSRVRKSICLFIEIASIYVYTHTHTHTHQCIRICVGYG